MEIDSISTDFSKSTDRNAKTPVVVEENTPSDEKNAEEVPFSFYIPSCHCMDEEKPIEEDVKSIVTEKKEVLPNEVLAPDHPALARFQKAFKDHLLQQIDYLKNEIYKYDTDTAEKNAQREAMGVETYETQQLVCKQQKLLEDYIENLKNTTAAREELENQLREEKTRYKQEQEKLFIVEKEEKSLRNELEALSLLVQKTSNWENMIESDITINKRMAEKSRKDQMKLMQEKKKQDMILYKLQTEVWKLETELETVDLKLEVKENEREELAQAVAEGTTNIEALEAELRCLMHSWNSVVIAISNRDKVLNCVNEDMHKYGEELKTVTCETEQVRKLTRQQMQKNEEYTAIKQRILAEIMMCRNALEDETNRQKKMEKKIQDVQQISDQTERDIVKVQEENKNLDNLLKTLTRQSNKLYQSKVTWEEKIFKKYEMETTNNKALQNLATRYRDIRTQNRKLEINLALSENKNSLTQTKFESQMYINNDLDNLIKELDGQKNELEKENNSLQDELSKIEGLIKARQRHTDKLNKKMLDIMTTTGGKTISPSEIKIKVLEKNIDEIKENIKQLQQFWMKEQRNVINLAETRQEQISSNDLIKKQILILQQKNLKITDDLDGIKIQHQKTTRNILNLHNQILMKSETLSKKKGTKQYLDVHNDLTQADYLNKLKISELDCLKIEAEIGEIEEDKISMSKQLLEINREVLEWEKKLKLIVETKSQIQEEKSSSGEIGHMKAEVHRMEVRYNQLKKAQEKLVCDMEHCVTRRESIFSTTEAREKKGSSSIEKTRFNFNRKIDDTRNKIKQVENEVAVVKSKVAKVAEEKKHFQQQLDLIKQDLSEIGKLTDDLLTEYENMKSSKQVQFELLVIKQKKLNMYTDLSKGKKPFISFKTDCALVREYNKHNEINGRLISLVESLMAYFPNYVHCFNRVLNSLSLPKVYGQMEDWVCTEFEKEQNV